MVKEQVICSYDGSFEGFLTTIFTIYEQKLEVVDICPDRQPSTDMFSTFFPVVSNRGHAQRVLKGLQKHADKRIVKDIYRCFLSELQGVEYRLFLLIQRIFKENSSHFYDYGDDNIMELHKILKMMRREVHRMHAFTRFQELKDGSFAAVIEPDFNVLPLIGDHFEDRYPAMEWLIFDVKRQYGLYYKDYKTQYVGFQEKLLEIKVTSLSEEEVEYQDMWKQYFKSVNISERNNTKLHLRHVPKRYWKNLIEKQ